MEDLQLINNIDQEQYEFHIEGHIAKAVYEKYADHIIAITHVVVPHELEGKGVGSQLVKKVLTDLDQQEIKVIPICPFVDSYIKRHPEWTQIIADENE